MRTRRGIPPADGGIAPQATTESPVSGWRYFLFSLYIRQNPYDIYNEDLKGDHHVTTENLCRQERHNVCPLHQRKDCNPGPQKPNLGNEGLQVREFP